MATPTRRAGSKRAAASKAASSFVEQLASSSPVRPPDVEQSGASGPLSSDSELTELSADERMDITPTKAPVSTTSGGLGQSAGRKFDDFSPSRSPKVKRTYARKDRAMLPDVHTTSPTASSSRIPQTPTSPLTPLSSPMRSPSKTSRGKPSNKLSSIFGSPLTTLPTTPSKRKRRVNTDTGNDEDESSPTRGSPSKRRNTANSGAKSPTKNGKTPSRSSSKKDWSLDILKDTVWVKVTDRNELVVNGKDSRKTFWWPAKVTARPPKGTSIKVLLLNPPNPVASASLEIRDPSQANIRSRLDSSSTERFNENTYCEDPAENQLVSSSKGLDYDARWRAAVQQMRQEEDKHDEFPESLADLLSQSTASKLEGYETDTVSEPKVVEAQVSAKPSPRKGKAKIKQVSKSKKEIFKEQWTDLPDTTLEIPGELVLSLEKKRTTVYWPGTVMEFKPPADETKVGKYLVKLFDGMEVLVTRQMFLSAEQNDFATCKLGELRPPQTTSQGDDQDTSRTPSPEPLTSVRSFREFQRLPIRQQFPYIKPILQCVLNGDYPPAKEAHDAFVAGGAKRVELCRKLGAMGTLRSDEYEALSECVQRWALRDEQRVKRIDDGREKEDAKIATELPDPRVNGALDVSMNEFSTPQAVHPDPIAQPEASVIEPQLNGGNDHAASTLLQPPPSSSVATPAGEAITDETGDKESKSATNEPSAVPFTNSTPIHENGTASRNLAIAVNNRLHGCAAYEGLSPSERIDYCTSVLLQEAVYQILIWRSGERNDSQRLSDEEETRLRNIGFAKATEVNAWTTALHLREMKRKELGLPSETKPAPAQINPNETISRTRRRNA